MLRTIFVCDIQPELDPYPRNSRSECELALTKVANHRGCITVKTQGLSSAYCGS